jgi:hypothetical protein
MYYQILEQLPKIPEQLIKQNVDKHFRTESGLFAPINSDSYKHLVRFSATELLQSWISKHITKQFIKIELTATHDVADDNYDFFTPHTDSTRNYTLIYLLQSGGENHKTVFYKHKNPNIEISRQLNFSHDDVIEVDSVQIPLHTWTILNAQEIHSVENIPHNRISIQVSLDINLWEVQ